MNDKIKIFNIIFGIHCDCGNNNPELFIVKIKKNFNNGDYIVVKYLCLICERSYTGKFTLEEDEI